MKIKHSAGIALFYKNKMLMIHPTNHGKMNSWGFAKGGIEKGETPLQAAYRETFEEIGLKIPIEELTSKPIIFEYIDKKGKKFKTVYCYVYYLKSIPEDVIDDNWPKHYLQLEEVDEARFMTKEEATEKIFWRFKPLLELFKT